MNQPFQCVVVDDDRFIREQIADLLSGGYPEAILAASCADGQEGLSAIRSNRPDLVFLDIQMPGMTGFEMLKLLPHQAFEIVFITSFDQYAIQAIRFSALDYLLKPINPEEFSSAMKRFAEKMVERSSLDTRLDNLRHNLEERNSSDQRLVIPTKRGTEVLHIRDIIVCNSESNYTEFILSGNRRFLASKTLSRIEEMLEPAGFIRVHRSHLVNPSYIRSLTGDGIIKLENGQTTEVSRRKLPEVKRILGQAEP